MKLVEYFSYLGFNGRRRVRHTRSDAQDVLLPEDDEELGKKNLEIAKTQREPGQPVIYVQIEKVAPQMSRLVNPILRTEAA